MSSDASTRVRTDPRISRRRKAVEKSRRRRAVVRALATSVIVVIVWAAFFSPLFAVRTVKVVGSQHVTGREVKAIAHLTQDDNLLRLSTAEVAKAAEALPWVRSARVERVLPGTLRIKIAERKPFLLLSLGAARWEVDSTGHVLAPADSHAPHLPILEAVQVANIAPGTKLQTPEVKGALRVFSSLPRDIAGKVVAVLAPSVERVTLSLRDGTAVRYGAPEQLADKNNALRAVLGRLATESLTPSYIDVRVPSSPAVSIASADAPVTPVATPTAMPSPSVGQGTAPSPTATPTASPTP